MSLTRARIVEAAYATLREHGLGGVSMRRLAQDLGVQAGALYYHIPSKQDLLAAVAERILTDPSPAISATDPARAAADLRRVLLRVRDSAEVVSFAHAYKPETLSPLGDLDRLFAAQHPPRQARWAAQTLVHYVLGFVAEEQNRDELIRADILPAGSQTAESSRQFMFGVRAILNGLAA